MMKKNVFVAYLILFCFSKGLCQFSSINLNLYGSNYLDGIKDEDFDYELIFDGNLFQFPISYSQGISNKISLNGSLGISIAEGRYENFQTAIGVGSTEDRTYLLKEKRITFLNTGIGSTYWFKDLGKGPFIKGEFAINFLLSANSNEEKKVDDNPFEKYKVDFSDQLKKVIPLFKLGVGYKLLLGRGVFISIGLFIDIRTGSYFIDSDNFNFLNRGLEFGLGYNFQS